MVLQRPASFAYVNGIRHDTKANEENACRIIEGICKRLREKKHISKLQKNGSPRIKKKGLAMCCLEPR